MCGVARAPIGTEEGGACSRVGATGAPQHLRRDNPGPTTAMERRSVEGHLQLSEWRFRAIQLDGGVPRGAFHASGRSQGRVLRGGLPEQSAAQVVGVPGPDCPPG